MKVSPRRRLRPLTATPQDLAVQCVLARLPTVTREFTFHPSRRWRFDLCFVDQRLAVEVDGGAFANGRHTRGSGFRNDCEKGAAAAALGYRVLHVMPEHITSGIALQWVETALRWVIAYEGLGHG